MQKYFEVRKLRKDLLQFGLGVKSRLDPSTGEYGYIVYDLASNCCVGGSYPLEYSWAIGDVCDYISELRR